MSISVFTTLGPLRSILLVATVVAAGGAFFAGGGHYDPLSWAILPRAVVPTLAVTLLFVIPLDMLMTRVFMSDKEGAERQRFRRILRFETAAYALLVLAWAPFLVSLFAGR